MRVTDLRGNRAARDGLLHALRIGRLPHALLLFGPEGVGKAAAARALAQALLCPQRDPDACDSCNACRRVAAGIHPDLIEVEPEGQFIHVDAVRAVVRDSQRRPFEGQAKIFLFPHADRFNEVSGNTLLKTLEEPPEHTHLILVTTSREAVLPTLRSRCQAVAFLPLHREEISAALVEEGQSSDEATLRARRAEGSLVRARELDLSELGRMEKRVFELLLPLALGQMSAKSTAGVIAVAEEMSRKDGPFRPFLFDVLRPVARDALVRAFTTNAAANVGEEQALDNQAPATRQLAPASGPSLDKLLYSQPHAESRQLADALGGDGALALLADLMQAEEDLRINANKKLLIESLLLGVYARAAERRRSSCNVGRAD